jgi:hypothetical protein
MKDSEKKSCIILYWNFPTSSIHGKNTQWCCSSFSDRAVLAVPANIQIANYNDIKLLAIGCSCVYVAEEETKNVKPKAVIKHPSNYTNKMHNNYSLHIFTVFLLYVSVFLVPSSGRNYLPFAASHQVVFIFLSSTPNGNFWDVPLLYALSDISCCSWYVEQCTGDVTHYYSLLILCTLPEGTPNFVEFSVTQNRLSLTGHVSSVSGRLCGIFFFHIVSPYVRKCSIWS